MRRHKVDEGKFKISFENNPCANVRAVNWPVIPDGTSTATNNVFDVFELSTDIKGNCEIFIVDISLS
jgi:hypothetical protein